MFFFTIVKRNYCKLQSVLYFCTIFHKIFLMETARQNRETFKMKHSSKSKIVLE